MKIQLQKDYTDQMKYLFEGSVVYVTKELKNHYKGEWPSMWGTYIVKVKKNDCKIIGK